MNAKEMIETIENGKNVYRKYCGLPEFSIQMTKHTNGTYVYMDVAHGVFVTCERIEAVAMYEILGWAGDEPVLTIKTEEWFA